MIKVDFLDNAEYGADDINARIAEYVTAGIADPFTDGAPYNSGKLNDLTVPLYEKGVVPSTDTSLKCSVNTSTKTVTVMAGHCYFANGTQLKVLGIETRPYTAGVKNYVYGLSNLSTNTIELRCTAEAPTGDFVMLAEISEAEVLTDKRVYAKGKVPGYESDFNHAVKFTVTRAAEQTTTTHSLPGTGYNYFLFLSSCMGIYQDGIYFAIYNGGYLTDRIPIVYGVHAGINVALTVTPEDTSVTFNYGSSYRDVTFTVYAFRG